MQTCIMFSNIQVNTHGSFRFKQEETPFYNFLWEMKQNVQLPVSVTIIPQKQVQSGE